jgi:hypothetical protein
MSKSGVEIRGFGPTDIVVLHQADIGEFLRDEDTGECKRWSFARKLQLSLPADLFWQDLPRAASLCRANLPVVTALAATTLLLDVPSAWGPPACLRLKSAPKWETARTKRQTTSLFAYLLRITERCLSSRCSPCCICCSAPSPRFAFFLNTRSRAFSTRCILHPWRRSVLRVT